jgi:hypothetical protein
VIHKFREVIYLEDRNGDPRSLQGCTLNNLPKLASLLGTISERLSTSNCETVGQLWIEDSFWRGLVTQALNLVGLNPDWFTASMLAELLFPFETADGDNCPGLISMACFPKPNLTDSAAETTTVEEYRLQQLQNLVNANLVSSINEAHTAGDRFSNHEVDFLIDNVRREQEILKEKQAIASGEKAKQLSQELADELAASPDKLFGDFEGQARPAKSLALE